MNGNAMHLPVKMRTSLMFASDSTRYSRSHSHSAFNVYIRNHRKMTKASIEEKTEEEKLISHVEKENSIICVQ